MASVKHRIGPADHGRRMTLDEFREADEEPGHRYELARGVLEVTEIPSDEHGQIVDNIHEAFSLFRPRHPGLIRRIGHGSDIRFIIPDLGSDRHPDLAIVFRDPPRDCRGRQLATLAVEVVSPGGKARRRDLVSKREDYLAVGLLEYWIVDPELRQVTVLLRRGEGANAAWEERIRQGDDLVPSELLPGFPGRVSEFWAGVEGAAAANGE